MTAKFALIAIPVTMVASLGVALLRQQPASCSAGASSGRLFYMPIQIPLVASTLVWIGFLNPETGWLNGLLGLVGIHGPDWINSATWVYPALTLIGLWGIGNFMLDQPRRPAVRADGAVRGGPDRWRRAVDACSAGSRSR